MVKVRLDILLTERGLAESRSQAQSLIMAGQVRVNGQVQIKPAMKVVPEAELSLDRGPQYVSRGGEKLAAAIHGFHWDVSERICADVGASTGGFTDCLLQNGARKVYAIDVGYGILHWKLRSDPRVIPMERVNARYLEQLLEPVSRITIDSSFISLKTLLPVVPKWFKPEGGEVVVLIKPQFEAGRQIVSRGEGVVLDPEIHKQVLMDVLNFAQAGGYSIDGLIRSPLKGPKGNVEFLALLSLPGRKKAELFDYIESVFLPEDELIDE